MNKDELAEELHDVRDIVTQLEVLSDRLDRAVDRALQAYERYGVISEPRIG